MKTDALFSLGLTHLWQVTALIVAVTLLARLFARNKPHLALVLWLLVLAKCVTPPIVAAPFGVFCHTVETRPQTPTPAGPRGMFVPVDSQPADRSAAIVSEPTIELLPVQPDNATADWTLIDMLMLLWLCGVAGVVILSMTRVAVCLRRLTQSEVEAPADLQATLERLRHELGIRRRVNLMITSSAIGPAVIGLFRHRIVIPQVIAEDPSAQLEPILAHELIHIRRGDLWIGLVSLITRALWWFHPLVWWVSRLIVRDTERACDEEVIIALECRPAEYARSLLRVLEQKHALRPVPAFPGVRPVELTSQRMERIMNLRQGSRGPGGWRLRALIILGAAVVLPGAVASQEPPEKDPPAKEQPFVNIKATIIKATAAEIEKLLPKATKVLATVRPGIILDVETSRLGTAWVAPNGPTPAQNAGNRDLTVKNSEILSAPMLRCRIGSTATCQTSGHTGILLKVTPDIRPDGSLTLDATFECTGGARKNAEATKQGKKRSVQSNLPLKAGEVLMMSVPADEDGNTALIVIQPTRSDRTSAAPSANRQPPAADGTQVLIESLIISGTPGAKLPVLPVLAKDSKQQARVAVITSVSGPQKTSRPDVVIPLSVAGTFVADGGLQGLPKEWQIISRPQVRTLIGRKAGIEIGSAEGGIKLDLTPVRVGASILLDGAITVKRGKQAQTKRTFHRVGVDSKQMILLPFVDRKEESLLLFLKARTIPARTTKTKHGEPSASRTVPMQTRIYQIVDLITPSGRTSPKAAQENIEELTDAIRENVTPNSWANAQISANPSAYSLVIRQTSAAHEQIAAFLESRRAGKVRLDLRLNVIPAANKGDVIVLGHLVDNASTKGADETDQIPVIGRLPVVGHIFRSKPKTSPTEVFKRVHLHRDLRTRIQLTSSSAPTLKVPVVLGASVQPDQRIRLRMTIGETTYTRDFSTGNLQAGGAAVIGSIKVINHPVRPAEYLIDITSLVRDAGLLTGQHEGARVSLLIRPQVVREKPMRSPRPKVNSALNRANFLWGLSR